MKAQQKDKKKKAKNLRGWYKPTHVTTLDTSELTKKIKVEPKTNLDTLELFPVSPVQIKRAIKNMMTGKHPNYEYIVHPDYVKIPDKI